MERILNPAPIGGCLWAIPSKSQAHRLLICAALADKPTRLLCPEASQDIEATARCLNALGAEISYAEGCFLVSPLKMPRQNAILDCGESGSTLRFLLPLVAALGANATFLLGGRLPERPLSPLWEELEGHGCRLSRPTNNTLLCQGRLQAGCFSLAGNVSSQFITGLLFALPLLEGESDIMLTTPLESASYVEMSRAALKSFGIAAEGWHIRPQSYRSQGSYAVEGDWSNAAFWLCAGAISQSVTLRGLDLNSPQGDREIFRILSDFGAKVSVSDSQITVTPRPLQAIELCVQDIPDLVPPLALVAACAEGTTRIYGAQRLRIKESDRLESVAQTINAMGGQAEIRGDELFITGTALQGGRVHSYKDHRIAMLCAIASARCSQPVILEGAEAVNKSYPRFWQDFEGMKKEDAL